MQNFLQRHFYFGEKVPGYDVRVLNEREVRAGAGILFFFALISFMNAWLTGNFNPTKLFVVAFLIDFTIRIFINPKYSPSLILGRIAVANQKVEYAGAPQKRFAWAMGFVLALAMFFLAVINDVRGPVNLLICIICLSFLFFESVFGICVGCKAYNMFHKDKAKLCPGGVCEIFHKEDIQKTSVWQVAILFLFLLIIISIPLSGIFSLSQPRGGQNAVSSEECLAPSWAVSIGHEEQWKLHHGCK